jgi:hypothetical protein
VLETYDMPVVRAIDRTTARNNNRFSSFILGIVKSAPFQMRKAEEPEPATTNLAALKPGNPMTGNEIPRRGHGEVSTPVTGLVRTQ